MTGEGLAMLDGRLTLESLVGERVARLPDDARRLLETVAIGGRPAARVDRGCGLEHAGVRASSWSRCSALAASCAPAFAMGATWSR